MRSKLHLVLAVVAVVMALPKASYCETYKFTGGAAKNRFVVAGYIDGEKVLINGAVGNDQGLRWDSTNSWISMDVDTVELKTLLREVLFIQSGTASGTGELVEMGFGGLKIPFTIFMTDFYFHSSRARGWYEIDPFTLAFKPDEVDSEQKNGVMNFRGYFDVLGQQFHFNVDVEAQTFQANCMGTFDDSGYPQVLKLSMGGGNFDWYTADSIKLFETLVEGHSVEFYATYLGTGLAGTNWVSP